MNNNKNAWIWWSHRIYLFVRYLLCNFQIWDTLVGCGNTMELSLNKPFYWHMRLSDGSWLSFFLKDRVSFSPKLVSNLLCRVMCPRMALKYQWPSDGITSTYHPAWLYAMLGIKCRASCMLNKQFLIHILSPNQPSWLCEMGNTSSLGHVE